MKISEMIGKGDGPTLDEVFMLFALYELKEMEKKDYVLVLVTITPEGLEVIKELTDEGYVPDEEQVCKRLRWLFSTGAVMATLEGEPHVFKRLGKPVRSLELDFTNPGHVVVTELSVTSH